MMYTKKGSILRRLTSKYRMVVSYCQYRLTNFKSIKCQEKVFCIGFIKTGTKSLARVFEEVGYDHLSYNPYVNKEFNTHNLDKLKAISSRFDSFDDIPWNSTTLIPLLDQWYPDSKFIYLEREKEEWLQSFTQWTAYLTDNEIDLDNWLSQYESHKQFVQEYFEGRSDFISINVKHPRDYQRLLQFLGKTSTKTTFPHENKTLV